MNWKTGFSISVATGLAGSVWVGPGMGVADTGFRCGSGLLVDQGDHTYEVRSKCGEPDAVTTRIAKRTVKEKVRRSSGGVTEEVSEEREVEVLLDEWVYDLGDRRFVRYVAFENDRVIDVATGRRGTQRR